MIRDKLYINGEPYKPPIQNSTKNPDSRNYREALLTPQRGGGFLINYQKCNNYLLVDLNMFPLICDYPGHLFD
jgi:hypothetical protein